MCKSLLTRILAGLVTVSYVLTFSGCGPKAFTKGDYDDPTKVRLLDDKFNEADMQQMAETVIQAMVSCKWVANAPKPPVVIVEQVQNRTEEHIDMVSMTDKIRTSLIKSGKLRFVNKPERGTINDEVAYQHDSGKVKGPTRKEKEGQTGADYILSGSMATNIQQVGSDKLIYYKLTMNLTNLETSEIDCVEEKEIRKKYEKKRI